MEQALTRGEKLVLAGIVLAALGLRAWYFAPFDISHADEIMQYLEQAKRLVTGQGIVPWEMRYGARNSLIPQVLAPAFALGHVLAPGTLAGLYAVRGAALGLSLIALPAAWMLGALQSRRHALIALLVAGLWYESAIFANLVLSEVLAAGPVLLGSALLLADRPGAKALRWAGLLLGLGVIVRLQYAPFVATLVLLRLRADRAMWTQLVVGGLVAAAIGAVSDLAAGQVPFRWILVNLDYNMAQSRAARFGAAGPFAYVGLVLGRLGPLGLPIAGIALLAPGRYRPLLAAAAINFLFHSAIAHKEYRFVWLSVLALLVLAAIASVELLERLLARQGLRPGPAVLAGIGVLWLTASFSAAEQSGGARAIRGGAPIPLAANAALDGKTCGIAVADQWRAHLVPVLLPREVPLYVAPAGVVARGAALPRSLAASANVLVFPARPPGADAYREAACSSNGTLRACAYVRPGTCVADPAWSYQSALEREDL